MYGSMVQTPEQLERDCLHGTTSVSAPTMKCNKVRIWLIVGKHPEDTCNGWSSTHMGSLKTYGDACRHMAGSGTFAKPEHLALCDIQS